MHRQSYVEATKLLTEAAASVLSEDILHVGALTELRRHLLDQKTVKLYNLT